MFARVDIASQLLLPCFLRASNWGAVGACADLSSPLFADESQIHVDQPMLPGVNAWTTLFFSWWRLDVRMFRIISFQCLSWWQLWVQWKRFQHRCLSGLEAAAVPGGLWKFLAFGSVFCRESLVGCSSKSQSGTVFQNTYAGTLQENHSARICRNRISGTQKTW